MKAHQVAKAKKAIDDIYLMKDALCVELHDDMEAFPEGSNIRRCLTKGIDHLDEAERWLKAVLKEVPA